MRFSPFVTDSDGNLVSVTIAPLSSADAEQTNLPPVWQASWTSAFLSSPRFQKYAAKHGDELVALGAYEILE